MDLTVVTTHIDADFDGLGAMIAARKLYPGAVCVFPGSQEKSLRQFFLASSVYAAGFEKARKVDLDRVRRLVLVDVEDPERIGRFSALIGRPGVELHVYDHHRTEAGREPLPAAERHVDRVGATTTLLTEILRERGAALEPHEATMMLLGIFEDTGGLTFTTTTPRDFFAAGYLLERGADLTTVRDFITPELNADQVELLDLLLKNRTVHRIHGVEVTLAEAVHETYVGDVAVLAHRMCDMENIDVLILSVLMEGRVHLVARSRIREADVSVVARRFGGGGHPEAASATVKELTPIQVRAEILKTLPQAVRPPVTAGDICSSPVKTVGAGTPLTGVREILNRHHINAVPVTREGKVVGILTRMVVERASGHGLAEVPAEEYMTTEFSTVRPDTPLEDLREFLLMGRQRFLPVMDGEQLVGAVTRTDLLGAMTRGEEAPELVSEPKEISARVSRRTLEEFIAPAMVNRLVELGAMAEEAGMRAYLVGGIVRDLWLRRANLDVDVVVEGDALALARAAAERWGAHCRPHIEFATAKLILPDGSHIDVATARTEYYAGPAALPTVEQSGLKLDLYRRDFSINTLALRLSPGRFGEVIDFFGGLRDLKGRTLRILHNLSFVEDPTRVLRAMRFSLRFGFQIGSQTLKLLKACVQESFLARARGKRLFREWRAIFEEADPAEAAARLDELGILAQFHPSLGFTPQVRERFTAVREVTAWFELLYLERPLGRWKIYFLALFEPLGEGELREIFQAFAVDEAVAREFLEARREANRLLAELREAIASRRLTASRIYRICHGPAPETILFAMARTRDRQKRRAVSRFFTQLAETRALLGGDDLKALGIPPGPVYRDLLDGLLDARLDGEVVTGEEEREWVRRRWEQLREGSDFPSGRH